MKRTNAITILFFICLVVLTNALAVEQLNQITDLDGIHTRDIGTTTERDNRGDGPRLALADTGIVVFPTSFIYSGNTGRTFNDSVKIKNATTESVTITVAESTLVTGKHPSGLINHPGNFNIRTLIDKLRPAFEKANVTASSLAGDTRIPNSPQAYTTILTDERGENGLGAADILRIQYQYRTGILGNFHDFRIVLANLPDTNVIIILSIDTDQDFGTGMFPTPLGVGPTSRDIGSEREVLIDASGVLVDSLLGIGRIPAGVVVNDTLGIVGLPFLLSVQKDSVLTIGTETFTGGININSLNDPDRKMNIGFLATHIQRNANPLPDYAPAIGHVNIGGEAGVSWLTQSRTSITIASNDSASFALTTLAAKPAGTYGAQLLLQSPGRQSVGIPITMHVSTPPTPHILVSPTIVRDTLSLGDSSTNHITIRNIGGGTLTYAVLDTAGLQWISIDPLFGSVDSNLTANVSITLRSLELRPDTTYVIPLFVISNDPITATVPIDYTLRTRSVTSVRNKQYFPASFALHQNYPNPFNPETNISFDLPRSSFVTLKIYSTLGQHVGTIVNQELQAGTHTYAFGKEQFGLSSGVYLYRLDAGEYVSTKKLVLVK